jgi:hypothetical protein
MIVAPDIGAPDMIVAPDDRRRHGAESTPRSPVATATGGSSVEIQLGDRLYAGDGGVRVRLGGTARATVVGGGEDPELGQIRSELCFERARIIRSSGCTRSSRLALTSRTSR